MHKNAPLILLAVAVGLLAVAVFWTIPQALKPDRFAWIPASYPGGGGELGRGGATALYAFDRQSRRLYVILGNGKGQDDKRVDFFVHPSEFVTLTSVPDWRE